MTCLGRDGGQAYFVTARPACGSLSPSPDAHASTAERSPVKCSTGPSPGCPAEARIDRPSARPGAPTEAAIDPLMPLVPPADSSAEPHARNRIWPCELLRLASLGIRRRPWRTPAVRKKKGNRAPSQW